MASSDGQLIPLIAYIREQRGLDFGAYKSSTLKRRLEKRMQATGAADYGEYLDRLQASPEEFVPLLDTLFINVTRFFRDPEAWEVLDAQLAERLDEASDGQVRIWCAGVASGEEAYTVALLLAERLGLDALRDRAKIYATDVDEAALVQARQGTYTDSQVETIPVELRERYMEPGGGRHAFLAELRRAIIFGRHDLLQDAPISKLDLLVCRNTLMYFNRAAQDRIIARFHFALAPQALLFLGNAEMMLSRRHLFEPLDPSVRLFRKVDQLSLRDRLTLMSQSGDAGANGSEMAEQVHLRDLAFRASPVPQVMVDANGTLALANGAAQRQLGIDDRAVGRPFQEVELSYRPVELRAPVEQAFSRGEAARLEGVSWRAPDGEAAYLNIEVQPLYEGDDGGRPAAVSIAFHDVTRVHELNGALEQSRGELETAYEELQSTNEELETTNEELQSTIEELETTNEELQSTNEELETMNEELQSTNEEMAAVNGELREHTETNERLNAYLRGVLDCVPLGVVVLDEGSRVRVWSETAEELWGLRREEVESEPFLRLDIGLPVEELAGPIRKIIRGEKGTSHATLAAHDRRGRRVRCRVTTSPLTDAAGDVIGTILLMDAAPADPGA